MVEAQSSRLLSVRVDFFLQQLRMAAPKGRYDTSGQPKGFDAHM
jgi:hypothetical protein